MKRGHWWALALGASLGVTVGLGGFTFVYAKGASYLTSDSAACANCHIMREQYDGWMKSSHHAVAGCNDCHTPPGTLARYATKASNGFWHSFYFTTGLFPEPIQLRPANREVTEKACRSCHLEQVAALEVPHQVEEPTSCLRCHTSVGHLEGQGWSGGTAATEIRP